LIGLFAAGDFPERHATVLAGFRAGKGKLVEVGSRRLLPTRTGEECGGVDDVVE
jgi:hypothetical protein